MRYTGRFGFFILVLLLMAAASLGQMHASPQERASNARWWAFRSVVRPSVPFQPGSRSSQHPVDAFLLARLRKENLKPAPLAEARTLVRRVSFDLTGLPPSPERIEAVSASKDPKTWERLIDELLASPSYGERWARHWLDVVRYADTGGYETDIYYKNAWRYRDYVIKSLNDDKPYDRFVREQVAGDEFRPLELTLDGSYILSPEKVLSLEAKIATGLYSLYPQIHESNMDSRKIGYERLTDWVDTTAAAFLGITFGCARCHDHKFDPFTQKDYFAMQAIFAPSREAETPVVHPMAIASNRQHYPALIQIDEARRAYRLFQQRVKEKGSARTSADDEEERRLKDRISDAVLALPETIPDAPGGPWENLMEIPAATVLSHAEPGAVPRIRILRRGEQSMPGETVVPAVPACLNSAMGGSPQFTSPFTHRKALANWLTRPDHPLTARVIVNRVWQWHFGQGLVPTANDFGRMGQPPSHPELLDWLASVFVSKPGPSNPYGCGWSLKKLHKLLLTTEAYRRSSKHADPAALAKDPENRLLWRANRRRLEGEASGIRCWRFRESSAPGWEAGRLRHLSTKRSTLLCAIETDGQSPQIQRTTAAGASISSCDATSDSRSSRLSMRLLIRLAALVGT